MILLVTGGAGFIGTNYIYYHLRKYPNDHVVCYDLLTYAGNYENLLFLESDPHFTFVKGDICDREAVYTLFENHKPDAVINFAAESHVDRSIEMPELFLKTNLLGVQVLMDACLKYGTKRFHQLSTDEVYGDLPLDSTDRFTEDSPLRPSSPYSSSKASADLLALAYHRTYGLDVTVSRCSNNYGPYQHTEKLIPRMLYLMKEGKPLELYGNGKNVRDWIYVTDHCSAVDFILHQGTAGSVYNVGADQCLDNLTLIESLRRYAGKADHPICFVADRKGHDLRYAIDSTKLQTELGWMPQMSFEQGLRRTVEWYAVDN